MAAHQAPGDALRATKANRARGRLDTAKLLSFRMDRATAAARTIHIVLDSFGACAPSTRGSSGCPGTRLAPNAGARGACVSLPRLRGRGEVHVRRALRGKASRR